MPNLYFSHRRIASLDPARITSESRSYGDVKEAYNQVKMDGRTFLAYFQDLKEAEAAKEQLRNLGVADVTVDELSMLGQGETEDVANPLTGDFAGLTSLTLGARNAGDDSRIMKAAHPDASGLADADDLPRYRWVLAAVVDDPESVDQTREIIERSGGYL